MNAQGMPIIGLAARTEEYETLPLQWMPHIQVADVALSAARAVERGGRELMHGKDDDGRSQWAVLCDPDGASFGIIPAVAPEAISSHDDSPSNDGAAPTGRIARLTLTVSDAPAARDFYRQVVGWSVRDVETEDTLDDDMFDGDGKPVARICQKRGTNTNRPSVWLIHLPVGDLPESLHRVHEGGGEVIEATKNADGICEMAVVRDPVGVCLVLVPG